MAFYPPKSTLPQQQSLTEVNAISILSNTTIPILIPLLQPQLNATTSRVQPKSSLAINLTQGYFKADHNGDLFIFVLADNGLFYHKFATTYNYKDGVDTPMDMPLILNHVVNALSGLGDHLAASLNNSENLRSYQEVDMLQHHQQQNNNNKRRVGNNRQQQQQSLQQQQQVNPLQPPLFPCLYSQFQPQHLNKDTFQTIIVIDEHDLTHIQSNHQQIAQSFTKNAFALEFPYSTRSGNSGNTRTNNKRGKKTLGDDDDDENDNNDDNENNNLSKQLQPILVITQTLPTTQIRSVVKIPLIQCPFPTPSPPPAQQQQPTETTSTLSRSRQGKNNNINNDSNDDNNNSTTTMISLADYQQFLQLLHFDELLHNAIHFHHSCKQLKEAVAREDYIQELLKQLSIKDNTIQSLQFQVSAAQAQGFSTDANNNNIDDSFDFNNDGGFNNGNDENKKVTSHSMSAIQTLGGQQGNKRKVAKIRTGPLSSKKQHYDSDDDDCF